MFITPCVVTTLPMLLLLVAGIQASSAARDKSRFSKRCDVFEVDGELMCGPAMFLVGQGKCGTNAFKAYTEAVPEILWPRNSEVDYANIDPVELIRQYSPGVTPNDENSFFIKGNIAHLNVKFFQKLRATYPSAAIAITLCEPSSLPFRWLRHYLERVGLYLNGNHVEPEALHQTGIVNSSTPKSIMLELYDKLWPFDDICNCDPSWLNRVRNSGFRLGPVFRGTPCALDKMLSSTAWEPSALRDIVAIYAAGYELNQSATVVFMEGWATRGNEQLDAILRVARVETQFVPAHPSHSKWKEKVYSAPRTTLADSDIPYSPELQRLAKELCAPLSGFLRQHVPWDVCREPP